MGFYLKGIFTTNTDEKIIISAKKRWTNIRVKTFKGRVEGLGIIGPSLNSAKSNQENDNFQEINYRIEDELIDFSKLFPDTKFAFIFVDCWGGYCQYSGFVCQDGHIVIDLSQQLGESAKQSDQTERLKTLMSEVGIYLGVNGYFEPFSRDYFSQEKNKSQQLTSNPLSEPLRNDKPNSSTFNKLWNWLTRK